MDENEQTQSVDAAETEGKSQNNDTSGLLGAAIGAVSGFLASLSGVQTDLLTQNETLLLERDALLLEKDDWLREKNSLHTQIMSLNKRLSDCQEQDCGSDSIRDPEDHELVLTGEAKPPEINPNGGPS